MARVAQKFTQKKLNEFQAFMNKSAENYLSTKAALETDAVKVVRKDPKDEKSEVLSGNVELENILRASAMKFAEDRDYLAGRIIRKMIGEIGSDVDSVNKFINANKSNLPLV